MAANFFDQFDGQDTNAKAISGIESGGRYDALGPQTRTGDRAYGKYQVMGANVGPWTKEILGQELTPDQFVGNPQAQDAVFNAKFGALAQKYGPEGAARAWFAGEGGMNDPNRKDVLGTTVAQYGAKFAKAAGQQGGNFFDQFDNAQPPAAPADAVSNRFASMAAPADGGDALRSGLAQQATALTRGPETSPAQQISIDYQNQGSAAGQGTTPIISAHQKSLLSTDVYQSDSGEVLYKDPATGQVVPTDQNKHVVLRDPADNRLKVFSRTSDTDEGRASAAGRLLVSALGTNAPTMRPGIAAATEATVAKGARAEAVKTLKDEGVSAITAGQERGSKALKYAESTLGDSWLGGGKATEANQKAAEQFTAATLRRAGIAGETRATPEVLSAASDRIGKTFDAIAERNPSIRLDGQFGQTVDKVAADFKNRTGQDSPLIKELLDRIRVAPEVKLPEAGARLTREEYKAFANAQRNAATGATEISGETYQSLSSEISRHMRSVSTPELKIALGEVKDALDGAVARGLKDSKDLALWQEARRQWKNLLVIENAATGAGENAAMGLISPQKLRQAVVAQGPRAYVRGKSDFAGLVKAGNAVLSPLPDSGTAQRAAANMVPSLISSTVGAGALGPAGIAAAVAPGITGRVLMSSPVQRMLSPGQATRSNPLADLLLRSGQIPRLADETAQ